MIERLLSSNEGEHRPLLKASVSQCFATKFFISSRLRIPTCSTVPSRKVRACTVIKGSRYEGSTRAMNAKAARRV